MLRPVILGFDTSAAHCAAALLCDDAIYGVQHLDMAKGQAEALMRVLQQSLDSKGMTFSDLDAIAVGVGPGNFTGIRISVAAARGLALSLGMPAVAVSSFEIMRDPSGLAAHAAELVSVAAPRGQAYVQPFRYGRATGAPEVIDPSQPPETLQQVNLRVRGHAAEQIAQALGAEASQADMEDIGARIARVAEWKLSNGDDTSTRPAPLYVRPADAAPPKDPAPVLL